MTFETLKKRADFLSVQGAGKKWVSQGLVVQVKPNDLGIVRVGYTVTKRTSKLAVTRNRIKRRMREAARVVIPEIAQDSCDYILVGRPATEDRPFDVLCKDIKWCLNKMGYVR